MHFRATSRLLLVLPVLTFAAVRASAQIATDLSDEDRAFVAKVSQGGMYEVALAQYAETHALAQDVKDQANTEAHDHALVGDKLRAIALGAGMSFPAELNAEFSARLEKLKATPPDQFDAAYLEDMKKIHKIDGAAFAKEAKHGTNPDLKAFAAETHRIVERHLGELGVSPN